MMFTGERFVPEVRGSIALEHLHRYRFSRQLSVEKRVLDVACGEGYGSAMLAEVAASVRGVDIDEETIAFARRTYARTNVDFHVASCARLPFPDAAFDVVVSFETLEHVGADEQISMLSEIRRTLAVDGTLIISTPNRLVYTDRPAYRNPFHIHELYVEEFRTLLARHFTSVTLYGQRVSAASFLISERGEDDGASIESDANDLTEHATYVVAVCGASRPTLPQRSAYLSPLDDPMASLQSEVARREGELLALQAEYAKLEGGYLHLLEEYRKLRPSDE